MPKQSFSLFTFLEEAKRRNVLRVGFAYLVVAFAVLQGADLVLPALLLPGWTFRMLVVVVLFLFPIVLVLAWIYDLTPDGVRRTADAPHDAADPTAGAVEPGAQPRLPAGTAAGSAASRGVPPAAAHSVAVALAPAYPAGASDIIDSLAILPFSNPSGDADSEYLSDGITESIINKMATISGIRVVPRASAFRFKNREFVPADVARELNVRALVMGRVHQRGGVLVAQAELINLVTESQLWGEHYNRPLSDIFTVQEEMAEEIARSLRLRLTGQQRERLLRRETHDTEAYQAYLRGRFYWNKRTAAGFKLANTHFQEAIELDPNYALAYSGLADTFNVLGYYNIQAPRDTYPRAKAAAARALALDDELAEAHASLGYALLFFDRRYEDAARSLERAIELKPSYASAHQWYGWYLLVRERFDETLTSIRKAVELDPLSLIINDHYAYALFLAGRYAEAHAQIEKTLELDPGYPLAYWRLGNLHSHHHRLGAAIEALEKAVELSHGVLARGYLGQALAVAGRTEEARTLLHALENPGADTYISPLDRALIHAGLGEVEETIEALYEGLEDRVSDMVRVKLLPWPPELRRHPRFADLLVELGVAAEARDPTH